MTLDQTYTPICIGWEGEIRTMYRDTLGHCTVGDGLLLPSMASALVLPFQRSGRAATATEIADEYDRVMGLPLGMQAEHYASVNSPMLTVAECRNLLQPVIASRIADLTRLLPCFVTLSPGWQLGLLDMAYNLGTHGLLVKFPHFIQAVKDGNSQAAQAQCNRPQLSMRRNDWTRLQFES